MKRLIFALLLFFAISYPASAQQVLIGTNGGVSFDNLFIGPVISLELPIAKFELDVKESISLDNHQAIGTGWMNIIRTGGIFWASKHVGITGAIENSSYSISNVQKSGYLALGGAVIRTYAFGFPTRITVNGVHQFDNGVSKAGIETSHFNGGEFGIDSRLGCAKNFCVRLAEIFAAGRTLNQGNQYCDGSIGPKTCGNRNSAVGGSVVVSLQFEFPRRKETEDNLF